MDAVICKRVCIVVGVLIVLICTILDAGDTFICCIFIKQCLVDIKVLKNCPRSAFEEQLFDTTVNTECLTKLLILSKQSLRDSDTNNLISKDKRLYACYCDLN